MTQQAQQKMSGQNQQWDQDKSQKDQPEIRADKNAQNADNKAGQYSKKNEAEYQNAQKKSEQL